MSANKEAAFPTIHIEPGGTQEHRWTEEGMTLRDYFAGQALAGLSACLAAPASNRGIAKEIVDNLARVAYSLADDMLAERSKR